MFGTFKEEEERPNYGITKPIGSWNPVYANFAHYIDLFRYAKQSRSWSDTKNMLFKQPGWLPDYLGGVQRPEDVTGDFKKYNADVSFIWMKTYIFAQFVIAISITAYFLFNFSDFSVPGKALYSFWIIISSAMLGILFESKSKWVFWVEILRLSLIPALAFVLIS